MLSPPLFLIYIILLKGLYLSNLYNFNFLKILNKKTLSFFNKLSVFNILYYKTLVDPLYITPLDASTVTISPFLTELIYLLQIL